jgi:ribonuclease HII
VRDLYRRERKLQDEVGGFIAGVDEVGRGPLAGPVVAAAVILPPKPRIRGLNDSKVLSPEMREHLFELILESALSIGVGWCSSRHIDRVNILRASHRAMLRATDRLRTPPLHLLVDGLFVPGLPYPQTPVVGGDGRCACIAAASIVAKVLRDRLMVRLSSRYPDYGFDHNMGYPTPEHFEALARSGPCAHHRKSFAPVRESLEGNLF